VSRDDLLADLQDEVAARPTPPPVVRVASMADAAPTPVLDLAVTPLRWSLPRLCAPERGIGLGVRMGPVRVSFAVR
jgi:hypothetical protein